MGYIEISKERGIKSQKKRGKRVIFSVNIWCITCIYKRLSTATHLLALALASGLIL